MEEGKTFQREPEIPTDTPLNPQAMVRVADGSLRSQNSGAAENSMPDSYEDTLEK